MKRVAEMARPPLGSGLIPVGPEEEVAQELAADAPLDLGQLTFLGDRERQHQGGLLQGQEGELLVVGRVVQHRDIAEDLVRGQDGGDQPLAGHPHMGIRGHLDRAALLLQLAQHALDLRIEQDPLRRPLVLDGLFAVGISAPARMREQVEAGVLDDDTFAIRRNQRGRAGVDPHQQAIGLGDAGDPPNPAVEHNRFAFTLSTDAALPGDRR